MRQLSQAYRDAALTDSLEPVFVAKLINDNATIYLTTDTVTIVDVGSTQLQGVIKSSSFSSQSIKPEEGISSIGSMSIDFDDSDRQFTDLLTLIDAADSSIYNNKVELYTGFKSIDFTDYVLITPLYVRTFTPSEISYTLNLTDIQRITKKSLFADPVKTELVGSYGYLDTTTLGAISTAGYPLVEHNADWAVDPSQTIGYLKVFGISKDGRDVKEIISYTGKSPTAFTGVQRSRMGSERIDLSFRDKDLNPVTIELIEMVYIDLVQPAMLLALLTGDLYGQVGQTLPESWSAGIDASLINTPSFDEIGGDLWQEHIEFRDLETVEAKDFIAEQVLAPYGVFLRVDQNGQYELARYDYVSQQSAGSITLTYDQIIKSTPSARDAQGIKNFFQIDWGWRIDQDYYGRHDFYIDGNSQTKYSVESDLEVISLRGLRNRDKNSKPSLDFVAQSLVKRKSNPKVTRSVTALINNVLELEVGDLVTIVADNEPDYITGGSYTETFEVQSVKFNFLNGTADLKLFASEGVPSEFIVANGSNVVSIGRSGWTNLDGSGYGVNDAGTFKFNDLADIPSGKYYFDGDAEIENSRTITGNGTVYFDFDSFAMGTNSKIDMKGRGSISGTGYFGTRSIGQSGVYTFDPSPFKTSRIYSRTNGSSIVNDRSVVDIPDVIRVVDGQSIDSLIPSRLDGIKGAAGGGTVSNIGDVDNGSAGGEANGGGGLFISCTSFTPASSAIIDLSGDDSNAGGYWYNNYGGATDHYYYHGSSGFGWNGSCVVALKDLGAAKPFLYDTVTAKTGSFTQQKLGTKRDREVWWSDSDNYRAKLSGTYSDYFASLSGLLLDQADKDFATSANRSAIKVINLVVADDQIDDPAVDEIDSAPAPVFTATPNVNVPKTQLGDQVTYELTATNNASTKYVQFEYRLLPDGDFNPAEYKLTNESTIQETATGDSYEIRATAYNFASKAGGSSTLEVTFPLVERDTETSDGGQPDAPESITLPPIRGLELVNRINNDDFDKFKSGNAEFRWLKMSNTLAASVTSINGVVDLHLEGYKIRLTDENGNVLREEIVKDSFYTYTYDENKKDNDGSPVRKFTFEVQAVATTGYTSEFAGFEVENPESSAVTDIVASQVADGVFITYTPPSDVDFVGVRIRNELFTGSSITIDPSVSRSETLTIISVDQFGDGASVEAIIENPEPSPPSGIETVEGIVSAKVSFNVNTDDFDFVGTSYRYKEVGGSYNTARTITTNEILIEGLSQNTSYEVELSSVDALGLGSAVSVIFTTNELTAADVSGLGYWATVDVATKADIDSQMDNAAVVFGKLATGTLVATESLQVGDLSAGVLISGAGVVQTTNSGYFVTMGATSVPSISSDPLALYASDGVSYPFWIDISGEMSINALAANSSIAVGSTTFGDAGCQIENNSGNPRFYIGNGDKSFLEYSNGDLSVGINTAINGAESYNNAFKYISLRPIDLIAEFGSSDIIENRVNGLVARATTVTTTTYELEENLSLMTTLANYSGEIRFKLGLGSVNGISSGQRIIVTTQTVSGDFFGFWLSQGSNSGLMNIRAYGQQPFTGTPIFGPSTEISSGEAVFEATKSSGGFIRIYHEGIEVSTLSGNNPFASNGLKYPLRISSSTGMIFDIGDFRLVGEEFVPFVP